MDDDVEFRPLDDADRLPLLDLHMALDQPDGPVTMHWAAWPAGADDTEAGLWGIEHRGELIGYASMAATPGLPGEYDMILAVAQQWRRRGLGTRFLEYVCGEAAARGATQLSWAVWTLDSSSARFLLGRGYSVHHIERLLARDGSLPVPGVPDRPDLALRVYSRKKAVDLFCRVTDESFAGLPWGQPFSEAEVAERLRAAKDLMFMARGREVIGVAWLHESDGVATIEPFAIRPAFQGQGYGRQLLAAALEEAAARAGQRVTIGAWEDNAAALALYRRFGFTDTGRIYYLARELQVREGGISDVGV
jgi:mycothiol synthase